MRKLFLLGGLTALVFGAGVVMAQSDMDYQGYMKAVLASNMSLQKNLAAKDGAAAAKDASSLEATFKQVETFWQKRNVADAVNFAHQASTAAAAAAKAAAANDIEGAMASAKSMASNCGGCHMAHREGTAATGFKIKQ